MRTLFSLLVVAALFAPVARAADVVEKPVDKPVDKPAEKPTNDEISALIKQLGDDDFKTRDQAGQRLRKLGKDALPALSEASKHDDPEVVARAQSITRQIDEDLQPKPKPIVGGPNSGMIRLNGNNVHVFITSSTVNTNGKTVSITNNNGVTTKETTVNEDGKTIKIREDADGIAVTTTQKKDDKETSTTVKARDADALKKDNPEEFKLYEKHAKNAGVQINGGVGGQFQLNIGNDNAEVKKTLDEARKQLEEARKQAQEAQKRADEALKQAEEARKQAEEKK